MAFSRLIFSAGLAAAAASTVAGDCERHYGDFLARFTEKQNSTDRFEIFCSNLAEIEDGNRRNRGFTLGVNVYTDWTRNEFKSLLGGGALDYSNPKVQASLYEPPADYVLASSVDWRSKMPPIKNQGRCGSCWAFSAIDVVDFHAGGSHSEQQLVDCSGAGSCNGGTPYEALDYLASSGSDAESSYPYQGTDEACQQSGISPSASVGNVQAVNGEDNIAAAASSQVVSVCIYGGDSADFQHYSSGIFDSDCGSQNDGYCLGVVGYADDYWIIRNSWGSSWGQSGYMYFKRGANLCTIGTRGASIASANPVGPSPSPAPSPTPTPAYPECDLRYGGEICTCTTGCGLSPGESTPCVVAAGTDCNYPFSGATCCSLPSCAADVPICTCSTGCGLGPGAMSPCACPMGTDCNAAFSGCSCCEMDGQMGPFVDFLSRPGTGGHTGGEVPDQFGGGDGKQVLPAFAV